VVKYLIFWIVFKVLGRLPLSAIYRVADVVAALAYRLAPGARRNVWDNLRHVMPDAPRSRVRRTAKQVFRNVAYYYADLAHLPRMDMRDFYEKRVTLIGVQERLVPAVRSGTGAIMLSGHYGNPELVVQALVPLGIRGFAVTEPIEPPKLAKMLNDIRSSQGVEFMPVGIAGVKRIIKTLRSSGAVALMCDRDIEGPKMRLPLFGRETWMPTGPFEIGLRTGAPMLPCFTVRRGRYGVEGNVEEAIEIERTDDFQADVRTAALKWIERYESYVRSDPGQWAVLERLWDDVPAESAREPEKAKAAA
jgi:KDO2-lipid IV(A) lauroyltransferase